MTGFCDDRFHDNVTTISYEISNIKCQWFGWDAKVRNGMARSGRAEAPVVGLSFCAALALLVGPRRGLSAIGLWCYTGYEPSYSYDTNPSIERHIT